MKELQMIMEPSASPRLDRTGRGDVKQALP